MSEDDAMALANRHLAAQMHASECEFEANSKGISGTSILREINSRVLLNALRNSDEPLRLAELSDRTGLSRVALEGSIGNLLSQGWIVERSGEQSGGRGRPARMYEFLSDAGYVAGVDVGPHRVTVQIADLAGKVVTTRTVTTGLGTGEPEIIAQIIEAAMGEAGLDARKLKVAALGLPGIVNNDNTLVHSIVLPLWVHRDNSAILRERLQAEILLENDANLAAQAEYSRTSGVRNMLVIIMGHRVGPGMIINGQLHRGSFGAAGETGSMPETLWPSARAEFVAALRAANPEADESTLISDAFIAALAGDATAMEHVAQLAQKFAVGLAMLALTIDPEVIVIGGGMAKAGAPFVDPLEAALRERLLTHPEVRVATYYEMGVSHGAVGMAMQRAERSILGLAP